MTTTELGRYILDLLDQQNLSQREGSLRAGLDPTTINQIVRRGRASTPRPDTLRLLADALGGNYQKMLQLAGHLPAPPDDDDISELRYIADQLIERWVRIKDKDPEALRKLTNLVITQAEAFEAAVNAAARNIEQEEGKRETGNKERMGGRD